MTLTMQPMSCIGWLQVCGAISMARGPYDGVTSSIWYLYTVCCITGWQGSGSHVVFPCQHMALTMHQYDLSGVVSGVWCDCHGSSPMQLCCIFQLVPIQNVLHCRIAMVGITWPSTPCISMLTYGSIHAKMVSFWSSFRCMVWLPWIKPNTMMLHLPLGTFTIMSPHWIARVGNTWPKHHVSSWGLVDLTLENLIHQGRVHCVVSLSWFKLNVMVFHHPSGSYTKYVASRDSNGLAHRTGGWWLWSCKNLIHLIWFQGNCDIVIAQAQYNGVASSSWYLYKAWYITG